MYESFTLKLAIYFFIIIKKILNEEYSIHIKVPFIEASKKLQDTGSFHENMEIYKKCNKNKCNKKKNVSIYLSRAGTLNFLNSFLN